MNMTIIWQKGEQEYMTMMVMMMVMIMMMMFMMFMVMMYGDDCDDDGGGDANGGGDADADDAAAADSAAVAAAAAAADDDDEYPNVVCVNMWSLQSLCPQLFYYLIVPLIRGYSCSLGFMQDCDRTVDDDFQKLPGGMYHTRQNISNLTRV